MAQKNSAKTTVKRKRSKKQQAMFRRRRIVVGIAALIAIIFVVFCIYSVSQGIVAVNREIHHDDVYAISKKRCRRLPRTRRKAECRIAAYPTCRCR